MRAALLLEIQNIPDDAVTSAPAIISEAAKSPLGLLALAFLIIGAIGYAFFKGAGERTRIAMFVLMFAGVVFFAFAAATTRSFTGEPQTSPAPVPPVQPATGGIPPPTAPNIKQETKGANSPAVAGVGGNVTISSTAPPEPPKKKK